MTERIWRMKKNLRVNKYPLCVQLFRLANESLDETAGQHMLLRRSKLHAHILDNIDIFIEEDDLICGSGASKPFGLEMQYEYGVWTKEEVDYYKRDLINIFKYFKVLKGEVNYHGPEPYIFKKCDMKYAPVSGCWYRAVELEEHVTEGQKLGEIKDFHGNILHTLNAEYDGVVHSYWASLAIKEGQLMVGYGA